MESNLISWINIFAILLSPIIAIQVSKYLEKRKLKKQSKLNLFITLFSLRGQPLNPHYVNALNQIQLIYSDNKDVLDAWKKYYNFLHEKLDSDNHQTLLDNYKNDLFNEMSKTLQYEKFQIKNAYVPKGYGDDEFRSREIQLELLDYLKKNTKLTEVLIESYTEQQK